MVPTGTPLGMFDRRTRQFDAPNLHIAVFAVLLEHPKKLLHPVAGHSQVIEQQQVVQLPIDVERFREVGCAQIGQIAPGQIELLEPHAIIIAGERPAQCLCSLVADARITAEIEVQQPRPEERIRNLSGARRIETRLLNVYADQPMAVVTDGRCHCRDTEHAQACAAEIDHH